MSHVFRGRTLSEARNLAEAALGLDVVVLDRRKVRRKGLGGLLGATDFEIEAGQRLGEPEDEDVPPPPRHGIARYYEPRNANQQSNLQSRRLASAPTRPQPSHANGVIFAREVYESADDDEDDDTGHHPSKAAELARIENEVRAVRSMLFRMTNSPSRTDAKLESLKLAVDRMTPTLNVPERLARILAASGIDGDAAKFIVARLRRFDGDEAGLLEAYRDVLADVVKVRPWPLLCEQRALIALVGPPGVGKTTAAARIAALAIARQGKTVTFIACDTYRVGAVEQLMKYAALLKSPCVIARTQSELEQSIFRAETDLIIVDTAGRGPTDAQSVEAGLGQAPAKAPARFPHLERRVLLCVDASLRFDDATAVIERYAACRPTELAVTKLDLTKAPGGLVHATAKSGLPVSLLTHGQRVPEDMAPATAGRIIDYLAPRHRLAN